MASSSTAFLVVVLCLMAAAHVSQGTCQDDEETLTTIALCEVDASSSAPCLQEDGSALPVTVQSYNGLFSFTAGPEDPPCTYAVWPPNQVKAFAFPNTTCIVEVTSCAADKK